MPCSERSRRKLSDTTPRRLPVDLLRFRLRASGGLEKGGGGVKGREVEAPRCEEAERVVSGAGPSSAETIFASTITESSTKALGTASVLTIPIASTAIGASAALTTT